MMEVMHEDTVRDATKSGRVLSIDVLRGITIAFMILVNDPGDWVRRAAILFLIDLLLSSFTHLELGHLRVYGVLTRIAICYLCAGLILLGTRRIGALAAIAAVLLVGYCAVLRSVPVPGFGVAGRDVPMLDLKAISQCGWIGG